MSGEFKQSAIFLTKTSTTASLAWECGSEGLDMDINIHVRSNIQFQTIMQAHSKCWASSKLYS